MRSSHGNILPWTSAENEGGRLTTESEVNSRSRQCGMKSLNEGGELKTGLSEDTTVLQGARECTRSRPDCPWVQSEMTMDEYSSREAGTQQRGVILGWSHHK
jgi:hypothetical protein